MEKFDKEKHFFVLFKRRSKQLMFVLKETTDDENVCVFSRFLFLFRMK